MSDSLATVQSKRVRTTPQTLTSSFVLLADAGIPTVQSSVDGQLTNQLNLILYYTADAGATTPNLFVQFEFADNSPTTFAPPTTGWAPEYVEDSYASGVSTILPRSYKFAGTAGVQTNVIIPVPQTSRWARIKVKETVGAGSAGVITGSVFYSFA